MYFSVITPEERLLRQAAHELAQSSYAEHQWLWKFFPNGKDQTRDFIFRRHEIGQSPRLYAVSPFEKTTYTESTGDERVPRFYVVSQRPPTAFSEAWQAQSRVYDPQLLEGQRLSFQLCANPVVAKKNDAGKSQRHDVVMQAKKQLLAEHGLNFDAKWKEWPDEDDKPLLYELVQKSCIEWLQSRAGNHGFTVIAASIDAYQQNRTGIRNIQFSTVDFSGELLVTDPELFQQVLFNGLGHAKAFGCGLLLVKRIESE